MKEVLSPSELSSSEERFQMSLTQEDFDMGEKPFCEKYNCHRAKYYRLKKVFKDTGKASIWTGYHKKEIQTLASGGFGEEYDPKELSKEAESHAVFFLHEAKESIFPEVVEDLRQEMLARFLEMADHEDFRKPAFRMGLSRNIVRNYLKNERRNRKRREGLYSKEDNEQNFDFFEDHGIKQEDVYFVDQIIEKVDNESDKLLLMEYLLYNGKKNSEIERIIEENNIDSLV